MFFNSKAVALLLATVVATLTTAFLWLVPDVGTQELVVTLLLSFAATYIMVWITFEFLVFKKIADIYEVLNKLGDIDLASEEDEDIKRSSNPFKRINQEIYTYAVTKQREIEDLKKLEAFRREFLADISHELKTPVFAAQGFVHTLLDGAVDDKKVRGKFLKRAAKSLDKLDALIQDLLMLSQIETGELKMHFEYFDILELAHEILDQLENKAHKKGLYLKFDQEYNEPILVRADHKRIYSVLLNLVSNAIKYSEKGGVTISFDMGKKEVTIFVKDTGLGIPPEHLGRIFERFFRVEKSRSKEMGGTGLGLAIVKHIIEAHHSEVSVTSTVDKGSVFSFALSTKQDNHQADVEELELNLDESALDI